MSKIRATDCGAVTEGLTPVPLRPPQTPHK